MRQQSFGRLVVFGLGAFFTTLPGVTGCGARGPLDVTVIEQPETDASFDGPAVDVQDASTDVTDSSVVDAPQDAGVTGIDSPVVNCGTCVAESCGQQLFQCATSTTCRMALQCAAQQCVMGGTPDPACILSCASGDAMTLSQLLGIFGCIATSCGTQCTGVIGG